MGEITINPKHNVFKKYKEVIYVNPYIHIPAIPVITIDGLVSYYKLNDNVVDNFGTNNGVNNSVSYGVGKIGNAAVFNGTSSYVSLGSSNSLALYVGSVSLWMKTSGAGSGFRGLVVKQFAYSLFLNSGVLVLYDWGGSATRSTGINLDDNLWHHVALVFDSGTANNYIYVDGVLKLTFSMTVNSQAIAPTIGNGGAGTQFINGFIDEVAIYNAKLTQAQITQLYNNGDGITL